MRLSEGEELKSFVRSVFSSELFKGENSMNFINHISLELDMGKIVVSSFVSILADFPALLK